MRLFSSFGMALILCVKRVWNYKHTHKTMQHSMIFWCRCCCCSCETKMVLLSENIVYRFKCVKSFHFIPFFFLWIIDTILPPHVSKWVSFHLILLFWLLFCNALDWGLFSSKRAQPTQKRYKNQRKNRKKMCTYH